MTRTEIIAINAKGIRVRSFETEDMGRVWCKEEVSRRGPLTLIEVTISEESRVVYRPRYIATEDFRIPVDHVPMAVPDAPTWFDDAARTVLNLPRLIGVLILGAAVTACVIGVS